AALASLQSDPNVEFARRESLFQVAFTPDDPYYASRGTWGRSYDDLYGLKLLRTDVAWDIRNGQGVIVAVVDTGVDYNHPDLVGNLLPGYDTVGATYWNPVEGTNPVDRMGHGTHVAGTIAAAGNNHLGVIGVAFGAKILPVKSLDDSGAGSDATLAAGIRWAADHGAQIMNMSWGGTG